MIPEPPDRARATESRLDMLREEARRTGRVPDTGGQIVGGPIPRTQGARLATMGSR